jgi:hypothetical protein
MDRISKGIVGRGLGWVRRVKEVFRMRVLLLLFLIMRLDRNVYDGRFLPTSFLSIQFTCTSGSDWMPRELEAIYDSMDCTFHVFAMSVIA